jgi:type II restriction/modification system DNA methylase subunit YeeA
MITTVTPSYTYTFTLSRAPTRGSMVEWYENEFVARAHDRSFSLNLRIFPLVEAYHILKIFGAFSPLWVA